MPRIRIWYALVLAALVGWASPSSGDDESNAEGRGPPTVLLDVGALTAGRLDFIAPRIGHPARREDDADRFGGAAQEPSYPYGQVEELIECLRATVAPDFWAEADPGSIRSAGERWILARAPQEILQALATQLGAFERGVAATVHVELAALRVPPGVVSKVAAAGPDLTLADASVEALVGASTETLYASLTTLAGTRSWTLAGEQRAFIDSVRAPRSGEGVGPLAGVNVGTYGLLLDARPQVSSRPDTVTLDMQVEVARPGELPVTSTTDGFAIERPGLATTRFLGQITLPAGRWCLIGGAADPEDRGQWTFLARATPQVPTASLPNHTLLLPALWAERDEHFASRAFRTGSLWRFGMSTVGHPVYLRPSDFTPPEPERFIAEPGISQEQVVEFIEILSTEDLREWGSVEPMWSQLLVRAPPRVIQQLERLFRSLEREVDLAVAVDAEVVEIAGGVAADLGSTGARVQAALAGDGGRVVESTRLVVLHDSRKHVIAGNELTYLQEYATGDAGTVAGAPVTASVLDGLVVDVEAHVAGARDAVELILRASRSQVHQPIRRRRTPAGEVELPRMRWFCTMTSLRAPLGERTVVATGREGDRLLALVVTPRLLDGE